MLSIHRLIFVKYFEIQTITLYYFLFFFSGVFHTFTFHFEFQTFNQMPTTIELFDFRELFIEHLSHTQYFNDIFKRPSRLDFLVIWYVNA